MSKKYKATEFSVHISRSKMRRYLHNQLNQQETAEVETHLKYCAHCSEAIISFIETEEPENYKAHIKSLKGKIIESVKPRAPRFSATQVKVMRAAAAVVILFTFSFFAFENLIDKDFSLVASSSEGGKETVRRSVFPDDKQQKEKKAEKVSVPQASDIKIAEEAPAEDEGYAPDIEEKNDVEVPEKPIAEPKPAIKKVQKKVIENQPQTVAENKLEEKNEENTKKEEVQLPTIEKAKPVAQVETKEETTIEERPETIAPIQKIEKVSTKEDSESLPLAEPVQSVPGTTIGQLRQQ